jgi:hypothetical protein
MGYTQGLTVREIRKILFDTDMLASINEQGMSNKDARDYLYAKTDQEQVLITFEKNDCLLIWEG